MNLDRVTSGQNAPDNINVIIEIPALSDPVKYEIDKETGAMFVDRFMGTAMHYPGNDVKIEGCQDSAAARKEIIASIRRINAAPVKPHF